MQIVIDIPEKTIAHIRSAYGHGKGFYPLNEEDKKIVNDAIYFGTPLPEEHGDLIDVDVFLKTLEEYLMWRRGFSLADLDTVARIYTPAIIKKNISKKFG